MSYSGAEFLGTVKSHMMQGPHPLYGNREVECLYPWRTFFFSLRRVITFMGHLYGIDPLIKPGVERGKEYTKGNHGKRGLEEKVIYRKEALLP